MRVFVTFSMVNLVFPPFPATLPMALDKWSPFSGFTAETDDTRKQLHTHSGHQVHSAAVRLINTGSFREDRSASSPSVTSKLSRKSSSSLMRARASWKERECVLCHKANPINYIHIKHQESNVVTAIRKQTYFHLESQNKRSDKICRPRERADVLCVFTRLKKKSTLHTRTDTNWTVGFIMKSRIDIASMRQGNLL